MSNGLRFNERSHRYWLSGKPIPGVTTLIGKGLPKPYLLGWAARMAAEYAADHRDALWSLDRAGMVAAVKIAHETKRDTAAVKGSEVHRLAEQVIHGAELAVPDEIAGYVESAVAFMDDWQIDPLVVERPCASRTHWFAGTPDLVARICDGSVGIFDYKTSASGIYGEAALQANAYAHSDFWLDEDDAEQPTADLGITAAYGVHLRPDGYDVYPLEFGPEIFADFLTVAASALVAGRVRSYVLDPVGPPDAIGQVA